MRNSWNRAEPVVELSDKVLSHLVAGAFPGQSVVESQLVSGGLSNTNYRLVLSGSARPVRLRVYNRRAIVARLERSIVSCLPPDVPVQKCLYLDTGGRLLHAFLDWVEGSRLEQVFAGLRHEELAYVGTRIGSVLARIHSRRFERTGILDPTLAVSQPFDVTGEGLVSFARQILYEGRGRMRLPASLRDRMFSWLQSAAGILDSLDMPPCLTHGDFGASNILVARRGDRMEVSAILDWEYACSGIPLVDLANLLRPPLGDSPAFEEAVIDGYRRAGGILPDNWWPAMRVSDMFAWLEMIGRVQVSAAVIDSVRASIERTMHEVPVTRELPP